MGWACCRPLSDLYLPRGATVMDSFTANWIVPALPPSSSGQVVYFWPGFKQQAPLLMHESPVLFLCCVVSSKRPWDIQFFNQFYNSIKMDSISGNFSRGLSTAT
jgi:hypothetical protein